MADMKMMTEKWQVAFKLLDFNKDGVFTAADRDACQKSFKENYQLTDEAAWGRMSDLLDTFWTIAAFFDANPNWDGFSMSPEQFVASREEKFKSDPAAAVELTRKSIAALINAADVNGTGKFSLDEFKKLHVAFSLADDKFIKMVYDAIGGDCSCTDVIEFYVELTMGQNAEKHAATMGGLAAIGML